MYVVNCRLHDRDIYIWHVLIPFWRTDTLVMCGMELRFHSKCNEEQLSEYQLTQYNHLVLRLHWCYSTLLDMQYY